VGFSMLGAKSTKQGTCCLFLTGSSSAKEMELTLCFGDFHLPFARKSHHVTYLSDIYQ
jgi:hypothetical protein